MVIDAEHLPDAGASKRRGPGRGWGGDWLRAIPIRTIYIERTANPARFALCDSRAFRPSVRPRVVSEGPASPPTPSAGARDVPSPPYPYLDVRACLPGGALTWPYTPSEPLPPVQYAPSGRDKLRQPPPSLLMARTPAQASEAVPPRAQPLAPRYFRFAFPSSHRVAPSITMARAARGPAPQIPVPVPVPIQASFASGDRGVAGWQGRTGQARPQPTDTIGRWKPIQTI